MNKASTTIIIIIVAIVVFLLARGPDGLICKHIIPSVHTHAERQFWLTLAGCDCGSTQDANERGDANEN